MYLIICSDFDSYDLIVVMDIEVRDEVLCLVVFGFLNDIFYVNKVFFCFCIKLWNCWFYMVVNLVVVFEV